MPESAPIVASAGGPPPALAAHGITKRFPGGVVANEAVDLEVLPGEIHALLGENGAGKSTLSNCFTGLYRPDEGTIARHGTEVELHSPRDAIEAGVGMVHQHFRLVDTFTVAENIVLGEHGRIRRSAAEARVRELGERYGLEVDPAARIWQLSVGQQQRVEIIKALSREADLLILDEPTAVLTPQEAESLFEVLRRMAAEGRSVIFISHKLDEVRAVADRVTVLRDGRSEGTHLVAGTDSRSLARLMVGRDILLGRAPVARAVTSAPSSEVVLEVDDVRAAGDRGDAALDGISLQVRAHEILGVCGVSGNGQKELAEVIAGMRTLEGGSITIAGTPLTAADPRKAHAAGLAHIPEDRMHTGLSPSLPIEENLALTSYRRPPISTGPFLRRKVIRARATDLMERYDVRAPGPATPTRVLSGGNVQKVLLARELSSNPKVLVAASPTRGLDVGAIETVRDLLGAAADGGAGVLLLSEDLDEILSLSDRIAVIYEGRILAVVDRADADVEELGLLMGGDASHLAGGAA
ncbi:ABC transporter ATP-binding protein [Aquihabitans sp. McL0605]|uniref:ABC transporter ATP-binding protein n=1 Tax=Aquihabitans sp. McL0605 TaxID=3415671 RepID=UPI003CEADF31